MIGVGVVLIAVLGMFGSLQVRQLLFGDSDQICTVTAESLASPNDYSGGDHPRDPAVGDEYVADSGCNAFERSCIKTRTLFGSNLDCYGRQMRPVWG